MFRGRKVVLSLFVLLFSAASVAQVSSPHKVMTTLADELFGKLSKEQGRFEKEPERVEQIVQQELMPHVDYRYAAFKILGAHIKKISKQERESFAEAMKENMSSMYANALRQYKSQQVVFEPEKALDGGKIATVRAAIVETGAPDIVVDFKLRKDKLSGQWKAFDMVIEGISMLNTKRAEVAAQLRTSNIATVTAKLSQSQSSE